MFTNLFFLIVVLLTLSLALEPPPEQNASAWAAFGRGMALYGLCLLLIVLQNAFLLSRRSLSFWLKVANIECVLFFFLFFFFFSAHQLFFTIPFSNTILSIFSLFLYFFALLVFHLSAHSQARWSEASRQLRLLIPFALPFMAFTFLLDFLPVVAPDFFRNVMENPDGGWMTALILGLAGLSFLVLAMIFFPFFVQRIWKCTPLPQSPLRERLEALCKRADFQYADMQTWTVMNPQMTAAIMGVIPRYRYVMFTKGLQQVFSDDEIEAILAHEMGHSKHRHLLLYPWIMLGMFVTAASLSPFLLLLLDRIIDLKSLSSWADPLLILIPNIIIMALYFRIVFGYFSRLFERQADLYIFPLHIPPQHMIDALNRLGTVTGYSHNVPSWHHYSIQQRIDFLKKVSDHPELIPQHHRKVWWSVLVYLILLAVVMYIF